MLEVDSWGSFECVSWQVFADGGSNQHGFEYVYKRNFFGTGFDFSVFRKRDLLTLEGCMDGIQFGFQNI